MLVSPTTIVFATLAIVVVSGQRLSLAENGKLCTPWQMVDGNEMAVNVDQSSCGDSLGYEIGTYSNMFVVRFCCPARIEPGPVVGPVSKECGRPAVKPLRTRIVGGQEAVPHSWPWLVSLQYYGGHFCGGTLIDEYHVVTAAHCLQDPNMFNAGFTVVAGLHTRSEPFTGRTQHKQVARIFNHEAYNERTFENDIAVLRLASPVTLNEYVNVACLPGTDPELHGNAIIAGWGTLHFQGDSPDPLHQANIIIMDQCKNVYNYDPIKQICAGNHEYSKDSCQGDSGGPLMHEVNGQWILSGAVSYGDECAKEHFPGMYARVSHYVPWIRSKIASS
jgi:secreted trypsin-like serine protease